MSRTRSSTRRSTTGRWRSRTRSDVAPHHAQLIERATARFRAEPGVAAVLVGGSVAHGYARPDSDVDLLVVVEEERSPATFYEPPLDGKFVTRAFLAEVAERGSEPARWAFKDAIVAYTDDPGMEELVSAASAYPEDGREERLRTFVAYLQLHVWYMGEADKRADRYLATYASSKVTLFAGRAVLAHNHALYPFHKWLWREVDRAAEKPDGLGTLVERVLLEPTQQHARELAETVTTFCGVQLAPGEAPERFLRGTEWSWRTGTPPPEDV